MQSFWHDLRYAARTLRNSPGFTIIAIITLGLGMAVNTTVFSVINGLILRPLPVPHPEQIAVLAMQQAGTPGFQRFSYPDYQDLRQQTDAFSDIVGYRPTLAGPGSPWTARVTIACSVASQATTFQRWESSPQPVA
jgi:putative ABC transport system permease protein